MKFRNLILTLALSSLSLTSAFALSNENEPKNSAAQNQAQNDSQAKDGEVLAWLIVLNKNELAAAKEASKRNVSPLVKKYAHMLQRDHSKNLQETMKISQKIGQSPNNTEEVILLQQKGKQELSDLAPLNNPKFQVMYIDAMVKGHQEALNKLDENIQSVNNPELKKHLEKTRTAVANHLKQAQMIQNKLKSNA